MSFCRRLYRYFQFWWRTEIEWRRLFSESKDNLLLLSILTFGILALLNVFMPHSYIVYLTLQILFIFNVVIFTALFFEWITRKWRILFPKQTLLHPNVDRGIGFAWREENPLNPQLPANFVGAVRLPEPGFQTPRPLRPFAPPALEYSEVQAQIYRRSRHTDGVFSERHFAQRFQGRPLSDPKSLYTQTPRRVRHSSWQHHSFQEHRLGNWPEEPSAVESSDRTMPEVSQGPTPKRQVTSAEVHIAMGDRGKRPMKKTLDLCSEVNYEASTSKCTEDNYISGMADECPEKWEEISLPETVVADLPEDRVSDSSTETSPSPYKNDPQGSPSSNRRSSPMKYSDSEFSDNSPAKGMDAKVHADSYTSATLRTSKNVKRPQFQLELDVSEDPEAGACAQFGRMSDINSCEVSKLGKEDILHKCSKRGSPQKQSCTESETGQKRSLKPADSVPTSSRKLSPKQIADDSSSKTQSEIPQLHSLLTSPKMVVSVASSKRKKETSSEEEDGSLHGDDKCLPSRSIKPRLKVPKIQETSESDNSEEN